MQLEVQSRSEGASLPSCAYCRDPIDQAGFTCEICQSRLHVDCHHELGRCPTLGCVEAVHEPVRASLPPAKDFNDELTRAMVVLRSAAEGEASSGRSFISTAVEALLSALAVLAFIALFLISFALMATSVIGLVAMIYGEVPVLAFLGLTVALLILIFFTYQLFQIVQRRTPFLTRGRRAPFRWH